MRAWIDEHHGLDSDVSYVRASSQLVHRVWMVRGMPVAVTFDGAYAHPRDVGRLREAASRCVGGRDVGPFHPGTGWTPVVPTDDDRAHLADLLLGRKDGS